MPKVTITQAYFGFYDAEGRYVVAQRGETVDVPAGAEYDRGEAGGAWDPANAPQPVADIVPGYIATTDANGSPLMNDELEKVLKGSVKDVLTYAEEHPEARAELLAREIGGDNRKGVVGGIEKLGTTTTDVAPNPHVPDVQAVLNSEDEAEILAYAGAHKDEVPLLLETEEAGKNRTSLVEGLNKLKA